MKKNVLSVAWVAALLMASTFVHVANAQNAKAPVAWGVENGTVKCLVQPSNLTQRDYASRGTWKRSKAKSPSIWPMTSVAMAITTRSLSPN